MKAIYIGAGLLSLLLGVVGVVLPVLPTVPFLLLAGVCFSRGSERLHRRLTTSAFYERHIADFVRRGGMTRKAKGRVLLLSTSMMLLACALAPHPAMQIVLLALIAVKFYMFATRIPTLEELK